MKDWSISYEAIDQKTLKSDIVKRTASFSRARWNRDALEREVLFFGISRTLPAVERRDLLKFADVHAAFDKEQINSLSINAAASISRILGKDVSKFQEVHTHNNGEVTLYTGENDSGCTYSEFHFGAGESSVIRMVNAIEKIGKNGLILIEELENGLHPVAAFRVVEYLISIAAEKSLQIVFTTHSEHVISVLPDDAIWASLNSKLQQGKLDIMSLRTLVGDVSEKLTIFVEDNFAKKWVSSMLRTNKNIALDTISIYPMSGDGTAVKVQKSRLNDPSIQIPSICVIDGDSEQIDEKELRIYRLYGKAPEMYIFNSILDKIDDVLARLTIRLCQIIENQQSVKSILKEIEISNVDHHLIFAQLGEKLGFISEEVVMEAFLSTWCECYSNELNDFLNSVNDYLPYLQSQ